MNSSNLRLCGAAALGLVSFAGTFPVTRWLLSDFSAVQLGAGRALLAALLGATLLLLVRPGWPPRTNWAWLLLAGAMVAVAFPLFSAVALMDISASGAGVLAAILPLLTALAAWLMGRERPQRRFWWACTAGSLAVGMFSLYASAWQWRPGNNWLAIGMLCAALGYTAGARAVAHQSAWQVVSWMLILAAPVNLLLLVFFWPAQTSLPQVNAWQWLGFVYLAVFSQLLGFIGWNDALAQGGIARVGQLQLLQPFITLLLAWLLLGEGVSLAAIFALWVVVGSILWSRRTNREDSKCPRRFKLTGKRVETDCLKQT